MKVRGDLAWYKNSFCLGIDGTGDEVTMYGAGHMDKKPLLLCATTGTSKSGVPRTRHFATYSEGRYITSTYKLEQPDMFSIYRNNFATIDTFNKVALGPKSVMHTCKVKNWSKRVFQVVLAICETNAYYAYTSTMKAKVGGFKMSREDWKLQLATRLVDNPFCDNNGAPRVRPRSQVE
jgi:hypothetical protein